MATMTDSTPNRKDAFYFERLEKAIKWLLPDGPVMLAGNMAVKYTEVFKIAQVFDVREDDLFAMGGSCFYDDISPPNNLYPVLMTPEEWIQYTDWKNSGK